jgi:hypothetical protein
MPFGTGVVSSRIMGRGRIRRDGSHFLKDHWPRGHRVASSKKKRVQNLMNRSALFSCLLRKSFMFLIISTHAVNARSATVRDCHNRIARLPTSDFRPPTPGPFPPIANSVQICSNRPQPIWPEEGPVVSPAALRVRWLVRQASIGGRRFAAHPGFLSAGGSQSHVG